METTALERATLRLASLASATALLRPAAGVASETSTGTLPYCTSKRLTKPAVNEARVSPAMMCAEARAVSLL
jgi:hypothetical protein